MTRRTRSGDLRRSYHQDPLFWIAMAGPAGVAAGLLGTGAVVIRGHSPEIIPVLMAGSLAIALLLALGAILGGASTHA